MNLVKFGKSYNDSPSDHIRALVSGYAKRHWPRKHIVILQAFIDDSASEEGIRNYLLAGYVLDAQSWISFSDDWDSVLRASPKIDYLHMVEANGLRGQFGGWTSKDRDKKVIDLGKVIEKHQPHSIEISVSQNEMAKYYNPSAPYAFQNPYFLCFYGVILGLGRIHKLLGIDAPVDFVFDEHGGLGHDVAMWYQQIKSDQPQLKFLLGSSPIFRDDRKVLPLQAADMLAWHLRRELDRGEEGHAAWPYLIGPHSHYVHRFNRYWLQKVAGEFSKIPFVEQISDKNVWKQMKPAIRDRLSRGLGPLPVPTKYQLLVARVRSGSIALILRALDGVKSILKRLQ